MGAPPFFCETYGNDCCKTQKPPPRPVTVFLEPETIRSGCPLAAVPGYIIAQGPPRCQAPGLFRGVFSRACNQHDSRRGFWNPPLRTGGLGTKNKTGRRFSVLGGRFCFFTKPLAISVETEYNKPGNIKRQAAGCREHPTALYE